MGTNVLDFPVEAQPVINDDPPSARNWERLGKLGDAMRDLDKLIGQVDQRTELRHEENLKRFDSQDATLAKISRQQELTNGRISQIERWQDRIQGALAIIVLILLPLAGYVLKTWFDKLQGLHP